MITNTSTALATSYSYSAHAQLDSGLPKEGGIGAEIMCAMANEIESLCLVRSVENWREAMALASQMKY